MAEVASVSVWSGAASFVTDQRTYLGTYSAANKLISVDIDGLLYKGSYASNEEDSAGASSGAMAANWGRAFLFASSAKTLQCKLDTGFPDASGQCLDADGKGFVLKAGAFDKSTVAR